MSGRTFFSKKWAKLLHEGKVSPCYGTNCLALLYNIKDTASFYSSCWNTGTNPDLAFASIDPNSRLPDRRVLENLPRSQHRPLLITPPRFAMAVPSMPVKQWNFCQGQMELYCFNE